MGIVRKKTDLTSRAACVILAGGQGTRLYPLTHSRCKPAVTFGGRYRLIDIPISNSLNSNMNQIFVISQYFSSGLNQHIQETFVLDHFQGGSLTLLSPEERPEGKVWYKGTADAVRKSLHQLMQLPIDYFLILSGDQLYNMDMEGMLKFADEKGADLTIASLPVDEKAAPRLGLLNIDEHSNVIDFFEKPKEPEILEKFRIPQSCNVKQRIEIDSSPCYLASMGIYIFKREALIKLLEEDLREDFGKHLIPTQIKKGNTATYLYKGYWEDIGTIHSYYEANLSLTTNSLGLDLYNEVLPIYAHNHYLPGARLADTQVTESIICDGAVIEAKEISRSVIGIRSVIKSGTIIRDSILAGNDYYYDTLDPDEKEFEIGKNCVIEKAIIDENVTIGDNVKLVNAQKLKKYDGDGIFIRDGIIIVNSGTHIPSHFTL